MATKKTVTEKQPGIDIFNVKVSPSLLTQAIRVYQENSHRGMSKVLTRGEMGTSTRKAYKQKGTGNARHGSLSSPIYVGGGVVFGPRGLKSAPKSLNQKMKLRALAGILSIYQEEGRLSLIDTASIKDFSTKAVLSVLPKAEKKVSVCLVHFQETPTFLKSVENVKDLDLFSANRLNIYKVSQSSRVVFTTKALEHLKGRLEKVLSVKSK